MKQGKHTRSHATPSRLLKGAGILFLTLVLICSVTACGSAAQLETLRDQSSAPEEETIQEESLDAEVTEDSMDEEELEADLPESEEPEEESAEEPAEEPERDEEPAQTEEDFTYTELGETMYTARAVSVWSLPTTSGSLLGALNAGEEVSVTGQCDETSWYRIAYRDGTGYVSDRFLESGEHTDEETTDSGTASEEPSPDSDADSSADADTYTYRDLDQTMYATAAVNVRSQPSTSGSVLGSLSSGKAVTVTGQCNETGWYRISYNGTTGYVSNTYLTADEPAAGSGSGSSSNSGSNSSSNSSDDSEDEFYIIIDWDAIFGNFSSTVEAKTDIAKQIVTLTNQQRTENGLEALSMNDTLMQAAQKRAEELTESFSHTRPDGSSCFTVLSEYGYYGSSMGENIAMGTAGFYDADDLVAMWMDSEGHRANILSTNYAEIGVGVVVYGPNIYAVQLFGTQ